jgi:hypothetical protein
MAVSPRSASSSTVAVKIARSASWLRGRPRGTGISSLIDLFKTVEIRNDP